MNTTEQVLITVHQTSASRGIDSSLGWTSNLTRDAQVDKSRRVFLSSFEVELLEVESSYESSFLCRCFYASVRTVFKLSGRFFC